MEGQEERSDVDCFILKSYVVADLFGTGYSSDEMTLTFL
jgi:hypothetical protein